MKARVVAKGYIYTVWYRDYEKQTAYEDGTVPVVLLGSVSMTGAGEYMLSTK
jgi:hypothetical protein